MSHHLTHFRSPSFAARLLACCAALLLLALVLEPAHAQAPDEVIQNAESALQALFTPCSNTKFLECISLENKGGSLEGFMNRSINGGTEATDIRIAAAADSTTAGTNFQNEASGYKTPDTTVKFWTSESFATYGETPNAVLAAWYPSNNDSPQANGRGVMFCGTLVINFRIFLTAPPGVFQTDEQALVTATRGQLRGLMEQVSQAVVQGDGCLVKSPPRQLYTDPSVNVEALYEGESVRLNGVVWSGKTHGLYHDPIAAKIEISSGPRGAVVNTQTDSTGYYEIDYPILDFTAGNILVTAFSPDPNKYIEGVGRVYVEVKKRGALTITASTDRAVLKRGDPITVKGSVSSEGKLVSAHVSLYSDALPVSGKELNPDGTFEFSFVPGTEPNRNSIGGFAPGIHLVLAKATLLGYGDGNTSVNYLVEDDIVSAENCTPISATVLAVQGVAHVTPFDQEALQRQGMLSGFAQVNKNTVLATGMGITAAEGARVAIRFNFDFGSDATVVVNGGGTLKIGKFCKDANGKIHATLAVEKLAQVAVNVHNNTPENGPLDFDLVTPSVSVKSVHTRYFINVNDAGATTIAALEGNVIVDDPQHLNGIELAAGSVIEVPIGADPATVSMQDAQIQLGATLESMLNGTFVPPVVPTLGAVQTLPTAIVGQAVPTAAAFLPTALPLGGGPTPDTVINGGTNPDSETGPNTNALVTRILLERYALPGAVVLGLVVAGVAFFVLRRRRPTTAQTSVPPQYTAPPRGSAPSPAVSARPPQMPESGRAPTTTTAIGDAFQRAEDEYFKLRGQLSTGRITQPQFEARLLEMMVTDAQGRYWMLGADSGKWYVHDGQAWVEGSPK